MNATMIMNHIPCDITLVDNSEPVSKVTTLKSEVKNKYCNVTHNLTVLASIKYISSLSSMFSAPTVSKLPPPLTPRTMKSILPIQPSLSSEAQVEPEEDIEEDEMSQQMTQSYSEISFKSGFSPDGEIPISSTLESISITDEIKQRPMTLSCNGASISKPMAPLNLEGSVHVEGNMTHFVAEDLEHKIRLSSPISKKDANVTSNSRTCTPSPLYRQLLVPQVVQLDSTLINDLESEANQMATSVDCLIENLSGILHSISSITADNVDVYKNAVTKMSDAMDANIKSIYTMMAKAEEVTQSMKIVESHSARIKEIKRLVDLFETFI